MAMMTMCVRVCSYEQYFLGAKLRVDSSGQRVCGSIDGSKTRGQRPELDLCIGYSVPDFSFHGGVALGRAATVLYEASLFQRINDNLQCGVNVRFPYPIIHSYMACISFDGLWGGGGLALHWVRIPAFVYHLYLLMGL